MQLYSVYTVLMTSVNLISRFTYDKSHTHDSLIQNAKNEVLTCDF